MGKTSQRKGAGGEREIVEILQAHGYPVQRGGSLTFGRVPDVIGLPGVHLEVKRRERIQLYDWMDQAVTDSARFGDGWPVVVHRMNRREWLATMRLGDWLELYRGFTAG